MSGITPILDTLLHQVLGKPVDLPPSRDLNEPVRPLAPGSAPQAVRSDSRLDPRPAPAALTRGAPGDDGLPPPRHPASAAGTATSSAQLHLSGAARAIADVLARYPGPPAVLRPATPLLSTTAGNVTPPQVAAGLQASVENSGLFYESHLRQWFEGRLPVARLELQPQMQLPPTAPGDGQTVPEPLQGLVRQQLEMVAAPALRWEGDVWSGLFLALVIDLPAELRRRTDYREQDAGSDAEDSEPEWHSELTLELAGLGRLQADLRLRGERLGLRLGSEQPEVRDVLARELPELEQRLRRCGLDEVVVRLQAPDGEDAHGRTD